MKPWLPSPATRWLIGIATLWSPIYLVFFMVSIGFGFFFRGTSGKPPNIDLFKFIFPLHCFTMILGFALIAVYVVHAVRSDQFSQEMRIVWVLILFLGNMLAFPVYWWLYLRPWKSPANPAVERGADTTTAG